MKQILEERGKHGVERVFGTMEAISGLSELGLRRNSVYIDLCTIGESLPARDNPRDTWVYAPRTPEDATNIHATKPRQVRTTNLFLSRDGSLYTVNLLWDPHEKWDTMDVYSYPERFWYEADMSTVHINEIKPDQLADIMDEISWSKSGLEILQRLQQMGHDTEEVLERNFLQIVRGNARLETYLVQQGFGVR